MITKNKTGKYSFLKYTLSVMAALSITLCFAVNSTTSKEPQTVIFKGEITQEEALSERKAAAIDRELAKTEIETIKVNLPEDNDAKTYNGSAQQQMETNNDLAQPAKPTVKSDSIMGWKAWVTPEQFISINPDIKKEDFKCEGNILLMLDENNPKDMADAKKLKLKLSPADRVRLTELEKVKVPDGVFVIVEEMPEFTGGEEALRKWIAQNVKYPTAAAEKGIQGKVYAMLVVEKDGSIGQAKIVRGVDPLLDEEALRVVNAMPKWKPGKQRGKEVAVSYTIPINFQLNGPEQGKKIDETVVVGYDKKTTISNDSIYQECEVMPEFPGGVLEIRKFIANNIRYPKEAMKYSEMGKVFVTFVVAKDGAVEKVRIARGITPALDNEAIRVVSSMPNWIPGKNKGEPVNVQYTIPVIFQLQ